MMYRARDGRYDQMIYARCGRSGIDLPKIALGLWQNFGSRAPLESAREMLLRSFDRGITHFDLANNYGPEYGTAEETFGRIMATDLAPYRDEIIVSTKAGYDMWPGPYGQGGGSRKYMLASLDQSLERMGVDYVDIFYSHRYDPTTPLEETMGALTTAVQQGKALYVGISSYGPTTTRGAASILREAGTPCLIHQPSYSMLNRWVEDGLLDATEEEGIGVIAFSPLAQGMLTDKYLNDVPRNSRAAENDTLSRGLLTEENLTRLRELNDIAAGRGQTLAQMAIAWVLRDPRVTTALVGASRWSQIEDSLGALEHLEFADDELAEIDRYAVEGDIDLWEDSSREPEGSEGTDPVA
ncbi:MAG: L-glyceraldehyde 3-phosphate reductase [Actinomycetota bacterium]|nr:L-glyceraldehyde 3-phosphate reductase [Actinomycetota bacterium]